MKAKKRQYRAPQLVRAGSFEELTRSASQWEGRLLTGLLGGAGALLAVS